MAAIEDLGLRPVVNVAGTATRVGGQRLHPDVVAAMSEAAQQHFAIDELQEQAGRLIAELTGAEAGYVTAGASAGLLLAAAACLAGTDPVLIDRLPETDGMANEVIVQRGHRNAYDHALRAAGARIVEVGYQGHPGAGRTHPWQIEAAIGASTVAVAHPILPAPGTVPLADVVLIAHRHRIPVIVDGAAGLPPAANLRRLIDQGADLVAFSGGKAIGGPQASGILCGRADLIRAVALQQLDMDVDPRTWRYRAMIDSGELPGPPHHGIGRSLKVGKETIVGLMVALRRYVAQDEPAEERRQEAILERIATRLGSIDHVAVNVRRPAAGDRRLFPMLAVDLGGPEASDRAAAVVRALQAGDPPVYVSEGSLELGQLAIFASALVDAEADIVADRLRAALGAAVAANH